MSNISYSTAKDILSYANKNVRKIVYDKFRNFFTAADIDDIVGDTVCKACRCFRSFDPAKSPLGAWVSKVAYSCVYNAAELKAKRNGIMKTDGVTSWEVLADRSSYGYRGNEWDADRELLQDEFERKVAVLVNSVREEDRQIAVMVVDGKKRREIAKELGIDAGTAGVKSFRIRAAFKKHLS